MGIIKVLKRKDGASLVVGVSLGFIISSFLISVSSDLTGKIVSLTGTTSNANGGDWRFNYLTPLVALILEILVLEILIWVYVWLHSSFADSK